MAKSNRDYIHILSGGKFSVGVKGETRSIFNIERIGKQIEFIIKKTRSLSKELSYNELFPKELSSAIEVPSTVSVVYSQLEILLRSGKLEKVSPQKFKSMLRELSRMRVSNKKFEEKYFSIVREYYGIDKKKSWREVKELALKGVLKRPQENWDKSVTYSISDATRLQDWIIANVGKTTAKFWGNREKINNAIATNENEIRKIVDIDRLKEIATNWDYYGVVDTEILK